MSKHFAVLDKSNLAAPAAMPGAAPRAEVRVPSATYVELIRRVFHGSSVVAVVGCGISDTAGVCDDIAAELAESGKRVVVAFANKLLSLDECKISDTSPAVITAENGFVPDLVPDVWHWAAPAPELHFFRSPEISRQYPLQRHPADLAKWLNLLRHNFDSVLLSCPALESGDSKSGPATGIINIAAAADSAVLIVEAGHTTRQQILCDQHALQSKGAGLAGYVLVHRKVIP